MKNQQLKNIPSLNYNTQRRSFWVNMNVIFILICWIFSVSVLVLLWFQPHFLEIEQYLSLYNCCIHHCKDQSFCFFLQIQQQLYILWFQMSSVVSPKIRTRVIFFEDHIHKGLCEMWSSMKIPLQETRTTKIGTRKHNM